MSFEDVSIVSTIAGIGMIAGGASALYGYLMLRRMPTQSRQRGPQRRRDFFKVLAQGLEDGTVSTLDDVLLIYQGVTGIAPESLEHPAQLAQLLTRFLADLTAHKLEDCPDNTGDKAKTWSPVVKEIIQKDQHAAPYAGLPDAERTILKDMDQYLDAGNVKAVHDKMTALASLVHARYEESSEALSRTRTINTWSVPLAIIAIMLTGVFGALSYFR